MDNLIKTETALSPEDHKKISEVKNQITLQDSNYILQYGSGAQTQISEFSNMVLSEIRTKDSGAAGEILSNLLFKIQDLNVGSLSTDGSFLSKLPLIGSLVDSAKRFMAKYETLSVQIEKIIDELNIAQRGLLKDIALFDQLYEKNLEYFKQLEVFIQAGIQKSQELREKDLAELKSKAETSKDQSDVQAYHDFEQKLDRFDKKIHDLQLSRMLSLQTAPQIRLIQNGNQVLAEKIQSSLLNTIPLWKNQIVIALGLLRQKKALEVQKEVTKTTNDLLAKNSEMLKSGTIEIAKESEKGIIEIETLKKINTQLIETIGEVIKIQSEGREKRKSAELELVKMESEIKTKVLSDRSAR